MSAAQVRASDVGDGNLNAAVVVLITTPTEQAEKIAGAILEAQLAACVNIVATVRSLFWWHGSLEEQEESLLIVKSRAGVVEQLTALVRTLHPYDVFELVALPIAAGNPAYLDWIGSAVRPRAEGGSDA